MLDIEERVDRGARKLDEKSPQWFNKINDATLDMGNSCECIGGQIYGGYTRALRMLGIPQGEGSEYGLNAANHLYPRLKELWMREIALRKLTAATTTLNEQKELIGV